MEELNHQYNTRSKINTPRFGTIIINNNNNNEKAKFGTIVVEKNDNDYVKKKESAIHYQNKKKKIKAFENWKNFDKNKKTFKFNLKDRNSEEHRLIKALVNAANNIKKIPTNKTLGKKARIVFPNDLKDSFSEDSDYLPEDEGFSSLHEEGLDPEILYSEEEEKYVKSLSEKEREKIIELENYLQESRKNMIPVRFKILRSGMKKEVISNILNKVDRFYTISEEDNEWAKLSTWVETLEKIPFNKFVDPVIKHDSSIDIVKKYLIDSKKILDDAVYGHEEAKTQIISIIAKQISNPNSNGTCIAIQGPMGNGKTTLIKEGVCKAMNRPFGFMALGGMQDSSYLLGHEYTYEGSKCGRIVEIINESGCLNPVIFFDELDKVSDTPKGQEITNLLCHLTDSSQNKDFHDKYFSGISFDLSKAIFIFSYNDESKINPILLDRMYKIRTDGFSVNSKLIIAKKYMLTKILKEFKFNLGEINIEDEALQIIINNYCNNEKGVRNLKRNLETIISKLNVMKYFINDDVVEKKHKKIKDKDKDNIQLNIKEKKNKDKIVNFKLKNKFSIPYTIRVKDISSFVKNTENPSISHMYI